jgi:hypothetical protein
MKIPEFKPSKNFLGTTDLPCLLAKVKNSKFPGGVATRLIKQYKKDPVCKVYLRGKDAKKISPWQEEMLRRVFVKSEWLADIGKDLKRWAGIYGDDLNATLEPPDLRDFKKRGLLPFFALDCVVIDEIKHKVVMAVDTGIVDEHWVSIYQSKGRWRLGGLDHFSRYKHSYDAETQAKDDQKWDKRLRKWHDQWANVFPIPRAGERVESDMVGLKGVWEYDSKITAKILKGFGLSADEIKTTVSYPTSLKFSISSRVVKIYGYDPKPWRVTKVEHCGSIIKIYSTRQNKFHHNGKSWTAQIQNNFKFCYHGNLMVEEGRNHVYRRVVKPSSKS